LKFHGGKLAAPIPAGNFASDGIINGGVLHGQRC